MRSSTLVILYDRKKKVVVSRKRSDGPLPMTDSSLMALGRWYKVFIVTDIWEPKPGSTFCEDVADSIGVAPDWVDLQSPEELPAIERLVLVYLDR